MDSLFLVKATNIPSEHTGTSLGNFFFILLLKVEPGEVDVLSLISSVNLLNLPGAFLFLHIKNNNTDISVKA
jgi:hypothetical protein